MSLENKLKGAFREQVYNGVDRATGIDYTVKRPSLARRLFSGVSKTVLGGLLGLMPVSAGCDGGHKNPPAPTNSAPNFTSTPITSVWEGNAYNYDADATDPEGDNPVTYSLVAGPSWASIDSNTGIVSGTPTGYSANTPENFTVRATDNKGNSRNQNFIANVTNLGTVGGTVVDIDGTGLATKTVDLWNSTYSKGRFTATTDGSGNFTIADTVAGGNNVPNLSDWNAEVGDGYTGIFKFLRPNYITAGDAHTVTLPQMILMHLVSTTGGTGNVYQDSLGNPSFLALVKFETGTRLSSFPTGGPHTTTTWSSFPVSIFLDTANAPTADNELADGSAGSNGVSDYVDRIRTALAEWDIKSGMTLFNEVASDPSIGIKVIYNPSLSGNGRVNHISYNADGTNKYKTLELKTGLGTSVIGAVSKHELGHALYNINHSADTIYIMHLSVPVSTIHNDEGRVAKYISKLPHNTNMDDYVDQ